MTAPSLSVVIPVYDEEDGLPSLFARLYPALDGLGIPYEVIFVNDGSRDRSGALLADQFAARPDVTRVILFNANFGQHLAILAGFARVRGERVVTLDADLQNPPEEIAKLLAAMDAGADYVGGVRRTREDSWWRRAASRMMNRLRQRITRIRMTDQGCMLRAYSRDIVDAVAAAREVSVYIPALAYTFAHRPVEVDVEHAERAAGESKYSVYRLIRLNFDLVTGFSLVPLQMFSVLGMLVAVASVVLYAIIIVERTIIGGLLEGIRALWDRDILAFFLIGWTMFGVGLLGEYVGRIYQQVRTRPSYVIRAVLERDVDDEPRALPLVEAAAQSAAAQSASARSAPAPSASGQPVSDQPVKPG
ncbi:MAG TPA: glycosyltransferase [Casimicrobiaceae bacterium]|nr:glycosyltransferase [Casimicrobiaceae bacterium]